MVIDHHASNNKYGNINLVDTSYPAVCQLVADLLECWNIQLSPEAAVCLLMGIYTDTGGFKYPPTSASTFYTTAKLVERVPDFYKTIFLFENSLKPGQIKFIGLALSNIHNYFSGKLAISEVSYKQIIAAGIAPEETEKSEVSNFLKSVIGWEIGVNMKEKKPGFVELSMRTRDPEKFPVGKLAVEIGGGGHPAAAGARLTMPFEEAKEYLLKAVNKLYPELGNP